MTLQSRFAQRTANLSSLRSRYVRLPFGVDDGLPVGLISMLTIRRFFSKLGLLPRLGFAVVPALMPWYLESIFDWRLNCFFEDAWYCIYYFHPPLMDVLFALLVLAPFISTERLWLLRVLGLAITSIFVHAASVALLVGTRGSISLAGVDSIFLNVFPIAVVASLTITAATILIGYLKFRARIWLLSVLAGLVTAVTLIVSDVVETVTWSRHWTDEPWLLWHVCMCVALYWGRNQSETSSIAKP